MRVDSQSLASRSSTFFAPRTFIQATKSQCVKQSSRPQLQVFAAKGKQRMRTGGSRLANQGMPTVPTPPVDPENVEFVIFVRSKKLAQWMPLSIMKGGGPANLLVKSLENDLGKKLYGQTLVENVGKAIYKDQVAIEKSIREQFPMFKAAKEFEYGFKIRDKENPKAWYIATEDIQIIPPENEMEGTPLDKVGNFFQDIGKSLGV